MFETQTILRVKEDERVEKWGLNGAAASFVMGTDSGNAGCSLQFGRALALTLASGS
jgi:hypothetical protein